MTTGVGADNLHPALKVFAKDTVTPATAKVAVRIYHFFPFLCFFGIFAPDLRAVLSAIATAWDCFLPCAISVFMFFEMVAFDFPFISGTLHLLVEQCQSLSYLWILCFERLLLCGYHLPCLKYLGVLHE